MLPHIIRTAERLLGGTFRRIDNDGRLIFEMDFAYEVAYTSDYIERLVGGGIDEVR